MALSANMNTDSSRAEILLFSGMVAMVSMPFLGALLTNSIIHKSQYRRDRAQISDTFRRCTCWQCACIVAGIVSWVRWLRPEVQDTALIRHISALLRLSVKFSRQATYLLWHTLRTLFAYAKGMKTICLNAMTMIVRSRKTAIGAAAFVLLALLLRRSPGVRLLATSLGALAAVEAACMLYTSSEVAALGLERSDLMLTAAILLLSVAASKVICGSNRVEPVVHAPPATPVKTRRTLSGLSAECLSPTLRTLTNALSPRGAFRRISMGGRHSGDGEEAEGALDHGHFILTPGGGSSQGRRTILGLVTRVSSMIMGDSSLLQSPSTLGRNRQWLSPQCRTIDDHFFSNPGDLGLKVRGSSYLSDKLKVDASGTEMELVVVDLVETAPTYHIAQHLPSVRQSSAPFMFIMQVMVPGKPTLSLTSVWGLGFNPMKKSAPDTPFIRSLRAFIDGDDDTRASMFKLIPRIEEGSWMIRKAVGQNNPVLLGRKLTTKFFCTDTYVEVDVDVGSSITASKTVGLVQGALKGLVIDMAVLLQGNTEDCLPESLLGTIRLHHLDLSQAPALDCSTNILTPKVPK